jgi:organic radical activating enzyme
MKRGFLSEAFVSFQGEGLYVGRRHLFLRFAGCPLRCRYCDTPESLVRTREFVVHGRAPRALANAVSVATVASVVAGLAEAESIDGISLTGGEPLAQAGFLRTLLREADVPRPRLLETSGTLPDSLAEVIGEVDIVSMDLKLASNTGERAYWDEHRRFLEVCGEKAYVKIPVDRSTSRQEFERAMALLGDSRTPPPVFLQPITSGKSEDFLPIEDMEWFYSTARRWVPDVRVIPQTHKQLNYR